MVEHDRERLTGFGVCQPVGSPGGFAVLRGVVRAVGEDVLDPTDATVEIARVVGVGDPNPDAVPDRVRIVGGLGVVGHVRSFPPRTN